VPAVVAEIAEGAPIRWIWHNALVGNTSIDHASGTEFIKWAPDHPETNLQMEATKLEWARPYIQVPEVLGVGRDSDTSAWLRTRAIPPLPRSRRNGKVSHDSPRAPSVQA
jgi:kanamycin kinase